MTIIDSGEWIKHVLSQCCKHWNKFSKSFSICISILHCQVSKGNRFTALEVNQKATMECGNSSKTASFFSILQPFLEWLTHCLYWGECKDVVSACMCDRHATSVLPKNNLEVLGNTEHANKKIFAIALGAHNSSRAASRGGCVVHVCLRADVAVTQLAHTISRARFVSTRVPWTYVAGQIALLALSDQTLCRVEAWVLSLSGTALALLCERLKDWRVSPWAALGGQHQQCEGSTLKSNHFSESS